MKIIHKIIAFISLIGLTIFIGSPLVHATGIENGYLYSFGSNSIAVQRIPITVKKSMNVPMCVNEEVRWLMLKVSNFEKCHRDEELH
jgi:hypothetical protein